MNIVRSLKWIMVVIIGFVFIIHGCLSRAETAGDRSANKAATAAKIKTIAITQIVEHPSADQVRKGILDVLKENGFVDGKNIQIIYENAQGSFPTAVQIANKFVSLAPDVIVPITTPSAQAVVAATAQTNIPVVFAAVTDPLHAKLVNDLKHPGGHVTGTTEFPPIAEQVKLIKKMIPHIKKLGIIYSPSEINSVKIVALMKAEAKKMGIEIVEAPATSSNEAPAAAQSLAGKVEAMYVPLDNTVLSAMSGVVRIGFDNKIPVFSSDPDSIQQGALASISYTQYEAGRLAGEMILRIFVGENPGSIPVSSPAKPKLYINEESAKKLGIVIDLSLYPVPIDTQNRSG